MYIRIYIYIIDTLGKGKPSSFSTRGFLRRELLLCEMAAAALHVADYYVNVEVNNKRISTTQCMI